MKTISVSFAVFMIFVLLCSCSVKFDSPQPGWITKNEKVIPKKIRGTYLVKGENLGHQKNDTIRIGEKRIFDNHDTDFSLSDSVFLKIYHHEYFLNIYERKENTWIVIIAKKEKKKDLCLYYLSNDDSIPRKLKEITKVNQKSNDDYIINPSSEEFKKILNTKLFRVRDTLIRIN